MQSAPPEVLIFFSLQYFTCCCLNWHKRSLHATSLKTSYKQCCERSGQHPLQGCSLTVAALEKWKIINESFSRCFDKSWIEQSLALGIKKRRCFIPLLAALYQYHFQTFAALCPCGKGPKTGKVTRDGLHISEASQDEKQWLKGESRLHKACR